MSAKAAASSSKSKSNMAAPTSSSSKPSPAKMHRRSRSGCFTCRLRRKKCDEGKPKCKACKHLNLSCDYKRPMWWSNADQRRHQKEMIKEIIKNTKLNEKQMALPPGVKANTPPSLCHSVPTSDTFSEGLPQTRAVSIESEFSPDPSFNPFSPPEMFAPTSMPPPAFPAFQYPSFSPYEVDVQTEREYIVNDVPVRKDSTISTFSTYQQPVLPDQPFMDESWMKTEGDESWMKQPVGDSWVKHEYFEQRSEALAEEPFNLQFFDFAHDPFSPTHALNVEVDQCDQYLLDHFVTNVLRLIFPILEQNQHGSARSDLVLPALESNKAYLHVCLSVAALHLKATGRIQGDQIDQDIMRHRVAAVRELCNALNQDTDNTQALEATLGMIFMQCLVGRPEEDLPDIPWHHHFQAATQLVQKLEFPQRILEMRNSNSQAPFVMTLAAWIDILGATMVGRTPQFADTYRELHVAGCGLGLAELMGCDDRIMFLISEICCLEALKLEGMDETALCAHVLSLGEHITATEPVPGSVMSPYSETGAIRPKQLSINMTAVFRVAARIYLCGLVPGSERHHDNMINLVNQLTELMDYIPVGTEGFDRSLVWPLLTAGSVSLPGSSFRAMFADRAAKLGDASDFGSFGRTKELLTDIWSLNDQAAARGDRQSVHWRDAMQQKGWDYLLI